MLFGPYIDALLVILLIAAFAWMFSLYKQDVSFVDSLWSLFFLAAALTIGAQVGDLGTRGLLVTTLVLVWSLRLSIYITARNWGTEEDYRYQSIRANNEPNFRFKSLYIVFGLQGLLAWIVAMPLLPAISGGTAFGILDGFALALWLLGFAFEAGGDYQLAKFRRRADTADKVLDTGFWHYSRHPNYFGDFCVWWAFYLFALSAGGWWTIVSPILMSLLLIKVSGVAMLEKTIGDRRPKYAEYVEKTPAFIPFLGPRKGKQAEAGS